MIRTTLSFTALFCLLAGACHLLFTSAPSRPDSSDSPTTQKESAGTPAAPLLQQAQREKSPLSLLTTPVRLQSIATASEVGKRNSEIMLVEFQDEEAFFVTGPEQDDEATGPTETGSDEVTNKATSESRNESKPMGPEQARPAKPELTPELILLREEIRECLAHYYNRPENVATRSPWASMHAMIAYGVDTNLIVGTQRVNAIGYLNYNGVCNGQQLFYTQNGQLQARIGPGVQGHAGQYLAMLAQSRVKTNFPMKVDGLDFTVADLIEHEKLTCRPNTELTFKLIALTHYLKSDEAWTSNDGQTWDIPRLIREELNQKIIGAACGGTHRLTGFSYAIRKRQQRGEVMEGQWLRAKKFIDSYHQYTFRLQNPDGSFSTEWFTGRADNGPPARRLETTGHTTEWLAFSLSQEELIEPQMVKSVAYLTKLLYDGRNERWNIGPLGHGLHALAIYDERVFGGEPGKRAEQLAGRSKPLTR